MEEKLGSIDAAEIFHGVLTEFTSEDWQHLLKIATYTEYLIPTVLLDEDKICEDFFLILNGEVVLKRFLPHQNQEIVLGSYHAGEIFGTFALMELALPSIIVVTNEPTVILRVNAKKLANDQSNNEIFRKFKRFLAKDLVHKIDHELIGTDDRINNSTNTKVPSSIVVLFGWRWSDIMHEAPFLAEHGYDAIKISPPSECVVRPGQPWWTVYQPVSYRLSQQFGSEEDFVQMVDFCHEYNLKVYADLVINHMAEYHDAGENRGINGGNFTRYHYGPLNDAQDEYNFSDFYHYAMQGNREIDTADYTTLSGSWKLEHYDFLHLPKLNLKAPHVVRVLRSYLRYLLQLGIDGFRLDAAKHLSCKAVEHILAGLRTKSGEIPFIYQEYYASAPDGIDLHSLMLKYFKLGYVTSFRYGEIIADALLGRKNNLQTLVEYSFGSGWINYPERRTVTVIDNHDTERMMKNMLSFKDNNHNAYVLAYIFMLAWPFGVPKIMSSFRFENHDDPFPTVPVWGNNQQTAGKTSPWVAQHRWDAIANLVLFQRRTKSARGVAHTWLNGNQIAFARVLEKPKEAVIAIGFVVINATDQILTRIFDTGLPAGKYFNLVKSHLALGEFTGEIIEISRYGKAEITVTPFDAVVLMKDFIAIDRNG